MQYDINALWSIPATVHSEHIFDEVDGILRWLSVPAVLCPRSPAAAKYVGGSDSGDRLSQVGHYNTSSMNVPRGLLSCGTVL